MNALGLIKIFIWIHSLAILLEEQEVKEAINNLNKVINVEKIMISL